MMTFAQELRHVLSVEPILTSTPPPAQPFGGTDEDWVKYDQDYNAWKATRIPKKRDPGLVRVLEVWETFDELLLMCQQKGIFTMPFWTAMNLKGDTDAKQLETFLRIKVPLVPWATLWTQGTYFRLLVKTTSMSCYTALLVGSGASDNLTDMYRALWDVGIREYSHHIHKDNPYFAVLDARKRFTYTLNGDIYTGVMIMTERP